MENRILVAYALIGLLLAFFALLGWLNFNRRSRKREERMRDRWLGRGRPAPGEPR